MYGAREAYEQKIKRLFVRRRPRKLDIRDAITLNKESRRVLLTVVSQLAPVAEKIRAREIFRVTPMKCKAI